MRVKHVTELNRKSIEEYNQTKKIPLILLLDNIRSLNNIGAIFRSSDAFRVEKIILCGITAIPPHNDIHKTALGAEDSVKWEYSENIISSIKKLKAEDCLISALELTTNSISLDKLQLKKEGKYALIVGNEVKGVQQEVVDLCDISIEIPQEGTKHSLNVSVATAVALWEFYKQLK